LASSVCDNATSFLISADTPFAGVFTITLNKPEKHNAFDEVMISELISTLHYVAKQSDIRIVCLQANGKSFCSGADLNWMKRMSTFSRNENFADANKLSELMQTLVELPQPTVAIVQGNAFGGGVGLVACCDIVIASDIAQFCLAEVKLGLIPAVISPYIVDAIGMRHAKRYMLTAEMISTEVAKQLGLIHKIVPLDNINNIRDEMLKVLIANGPQALKAVKECCAEINNVNDEALRQKLVQKIAKIRVSSEAQEGMQAFFAKRKPKWNDHV